MTFAAHFFKIPNAWIIGSGILSVSLAISKFCIDLWVWAAQSLSEGTLIGPKVSLYSLNYENLKKVVFGFKTCEDTLNIISVYKINNN